MAEPPEQDSPESESAVQPADLPPGPIPPELLEQIPEPLRGTVERYQAFAAWGPMPNPVLRQIRPEHVSALIEHDAEQGRNEIADRKEGRRIYATLFAFTFALVVLVLLLLAAWDKTEEVRLLLIFASGAIGGLGGGYVLGRRSN
jgi:hypothetical protein